MFGTIAPPPCRLLLFARLPELGKVKTRLAQSVGDEKALAIYEAMLRDVLRSIGPSTTDLEIEVFWAPTPAANRGTLRGAFGDRPLAMQTGSTLGDRLAMAFSERFFFHRAQKIIAIGVDDPMLTRHMIDDAFALLESSDWIIGPADDGGYYLIGARGPVFNASVFRDVPWGTETVLQLTIDRIREAQNTIARLPTRYDIDVIGDLERFAREHRESEGELPKLLREWGIAA